MPSGNTHEFTNMVLLPISLTFLQPDGLIPFIAGYLFSTFYLSPDLDIPQSKPSQRWGRLKIIWMPYQSFIPHRSIISHSPVIGSLLRLIYLTLPIFLTIFIIFKIIDEVFFEGKLSILLEEDTSILEISSYFKNLILYFTYGVIVSDLIHIALDISSTFFKGIRRKINQKVKFLKI